MSHWTAGGLLKIKAKHFEQPMWFNCMRSEKKTKKKTRINKQMTLSSFMPWQRLKFKSLELPYRSNAVLGGQLLTWTLWCRLIQSDQLCVKNLCWWIKFWKKLSWPSWSYYIGVGVWIVCPLSTLDDGVEVFSPETATVPAATVCWNILYDSVKLTRTVNSGKL